MNILVAEPLSPAGIELLKSQKDWNTIVSSPKEYGPHLAAADALVDQRKAPRSPTRARREGRMT